MAYLSEKKFDFVSSALPADTFGVVRFKGTEGFSMCYEFEVDLVSKNAEIDLTEVLKNPVTFTILREDGDIPFHGILTQFEQLHEVDEYVFYRAVLVPKLWWLSLTHHNQVILNKTVPEVIEDVLKDGGLTPLDFELKLEKEYPKWEYICQYRESHLNFVSRWMEREGMYYYFEQAESGEKVIITDTKIAHTEMPEGKTMYYSPPSGLTEFHREEVIHAFICRQKMLPKTLRLKDYNYRTPSLEISGNAEVSADGRGDVYIYGEHFKTPDEGNALAKIRAEELLCQEKQFHGESTIPYLRPGYLFDLEDHYRGSFNQNYLTIELGHEGSQTAFLLAGIQKGLSEVEEQTYYRNSFVSIPSNVQYRQERKTEKPRFYGTLNAKIDAAGSGKYAELDDQGRYKVILPFDKSGRKDGKASTFLRMAQPYAGTDHGMHFPLHKGTEVLLTFVDGDPDRPIVNAAVPNPEHPSQVTSGDQTMSKITTAGGNKIHMEDEEGKQRILLHTPTAGTFLRMGAPNDPDTYSGWKKEDGFACHTKGNVEVGAANVNINLIGAEAKVVEGESIGLVVGFKQSIVLGNNTACVLGGDQKFQFPHKWIISPAKTALHEAKTEISGKVNTVRLKVNEVIGNVSSVKGAVNTAIGEVNTMRGTVNTAIGDLSQVNGQVTSMKGAVTAMNTIVTRVDGQVNTVVAEETNITGQRTRMAAALTAMNEAVVRVDGTVAEVSRVNTLITGELLVM
jgi:type VI secretion system secreted protein VgrG